MSHDLDAAMTAIEAALAQNVLTPTAAENLRTWLCDQKYLEYHPEVHGHIGKAQWKELDDAFWTVIPFGTGGRRGKMYPIGSNAINDRTIGEARKAWPTTC
ncbi:MAG: hypothetical protein QM811_08530 [Pirellulales bacterium]